MTLTYKSVKFEQRTTLFKLLFFLFYIILLLIIHILEESKSLSYDPFLEPVWLSYPKIADSIEK